MEIEVLHSALGDKKKKLDTSTEEGRQQCAIFLNKMMKQGVSIFVERGKKAFRVKSYDPEKDLLTVQLDDGRTAKASGRKSKASAVAPIAGG